jgi:mono/diheme cytochrome c family protein
MKRFRMLSTGVLCASVLLLCGFADSSRMGHVPEAAASRRNPFAYSPQAVLAGRKLFLDHCATCHGDNAEGKGKRPNLHNAEVHDARDGELEWFLTNGNPAKGMPPWSKLPDQQRWQIVRYLKSLDVSAAIRQ